MQQFTAVAVSLPSLALTVSLAVAVQSQNWKKDNHLQPTYPILPTPYTAATLQYPVLQTLTDTCSTAVHSLSTQLHTGDSGTAVQTEGWIKEQACIKKHSQQI